MAKPKVEAPAKRGKLDKQGREIPDPRPMSIPAGFKVPETLNDTVQRLVRGALSRMAEAQGAETFDESEDFDVGDDMDPSSPFETFFDPILGRDLSLDEFRRNEAVYRQQFIDRDVERLRAEDAAAAREETRKAARTKPASSTRSKVVPEEKPREGTDT